MKTLTLIALLATLLTASCMKGDMPGPGRTNTTCESEYSNRPACDTLLNKHPEKPAVTQN